jgi:hypothetical protein
LKQGILNTTTMKTFIEKLIKGVGGILLAGLFLFFISCFSGTIVWIIWDDCIPNITDKLPADISWWTAVTLTWICHILIKASQTNNSNK